MSNAPETRAANTSACPLCPLASWAPSAGRTLGIMLVLVAIAAFSRVLNIAPNVTAVGAVALLAGFLISSRLAAMATVVVAMLVSDAIIGGYNTALMGVVYGALVLPVLLRPMLGDRPTGGFGLLRVGAAGVIASTLFFLITNFAVWALGTMGYAKTLAGLVECYAMAIPFYRLTMIGDVVFSVALFGGLGLVRRAGDALAPVARAAYSE